MLSSPPTRRFFLLNLLRVPDGSPGSGDLKFNHFRQLDYDGEDGQARRGWQLGNHLEGAAELLA